MYALDMRQVFKGLQGNNHHDCGAVGVGDDAARTYKSILGIAFGHNQRHIIVHAERAGIVYHYGSVLRYGLGKFLAGATSGTCEGNVNALEVVVVLQELHSYFLATESVFASRTSLTAEEQQLVNREVSLVEHSQELLSYCATGTNNSYSHLENKE